MIPKTTRTIRTQKECNCAGPRGPGRHAAVAMALVAAFVARPLQAGAMRERVVFVDAKYDHHWVDDPVKVVAFFTARGFEAKDAEQLGAWMKQRAAKGAAWTTCILPSGIVPESVVAPPLETCPLRKYLDAGGRVVWMANLALYSRQGPRGPWIGTDEHRKKVLGVPSDREIYYSAPGPVALTNAGKQWGLSRPYPAARPVKKSHVTVSFVDAPQKQATAVWLKNFNPKHPLSGFISFAQNIQASNTAMLEDVYRLAVYTGTPVTVPKPRLPPPQQLPPHAIAIHTGGEHPRRNYLRTEPIPVQVRLTNRTADRVAGSVTLRLKRGSYERLLMPVVVAAPNGESTLALRLSAAGLAFGRYGLFAEWRAGGRLLATAEHEVGIYPLPDTPFFFGIRAAAPSNPYRANQMLEELAEHNLHPAEFHSPHLYDLCLRYGRRFIFGTHPYDTMSAWAARSARKGANGEHWPDPWKGNQPNPAYFGLSNPDMWKAAATEMAEKTRDPAAYPAFLPLVITSDDFSARGGWDWAEHNRRRFKQLTGLDAPVPDYFKTRKPRYGNLRGLGHPKGIIKDGDRWLRWNRFLCRDVLGRYSRAVTEGCRRASPEARVGPVPGGMQWPLFMVQSGQYPPLNFGQSSGFNLLCYYCYEHYWQPHIAYVYWSEVARMGNRGLPLLVMPDCGSRDPSYLWNTFALLLAGGVQHLDYFIYSWARENDALPHLKKLGQIIKDYGPLLARLKPAGRSVGLLVPFSTSCYRTDYPLYTVYVYANLIQAGVPVEPVAEEEIIAWHKDGTLAKRYEAIVLADVDWLAEKVVRTLEQYALGSAKVIVDRETEVPIAGATRLGISLVNGEAPGPGGSIRDYDHADRIEAVTRALAPLVSSPVTTDSRHVIARTFEAGGTQYVWLVQLHTQEEYHFLRSTVGANAKKKDWAKAEAFLRSRGVFGQDVRTRVRVTSGARAAYDVLKGKRLKASRVGDAIVFDVALPRLGGALIALHPRPIGAVKIAGPPQVKQGERATFTIRILDEEGKPARGLLPLAVDVFDPDSKPTLYSRRVVAEDGQCPFSIDYAANDPKGRWTIRVRELSSGIAAEWSVALE